MQAKVLSDTQLRTFKDSTNGKDVTFGDTPILLTSKPFENLSLILRSNSKNVFRAGDTIEFEPYVPRKSWSILKAVNIKLANSSKGVTDV